MTTPEDILFDALVAAATEYCILKGLRSGIDRIAQAMLDAGRDEAEDIKAELDRQVEMSV
jgi:hypothetical protein